MKNVWQRLKPPIFCLAPMFGATDSAFRQLLAKIGKPDLMFTEFTNVQAIYSPDTKTLIRQLSFFKTEKPLICQIWGLDPELFEQAAGLIVKLGFDGVDINLGCPEKAVIKKHAGAALIHNKPLVKQIIKAAKTGTAGKIPLSAKIRLGLDKIETETWVEFLLKLNLDALIIHCRTAKAMSSGPAHWEEITKAVEIRNQLKVNTLIIGNGDIFSRADAFAKITTSGVDGVMIGRGVFKDPYIFHPHDSITAKFPREKLELLLQHLSVYDKTWGSLKPYHPLKRFFKIYVNGFSGALALRRQLMAADSLIQARQLIKSYNIHR